MNRSAKVKVMRETVARWAKDCRESGWEDVTEDRSGGSWVQRISTCPSRQAQPAPRLREPRAHHAAGHVMQNGALPAPPAGSAEARRRAERFRARNSPRTPARRPGPPPACGAEARRRHAERFRARDVHSMPRFGKPFAVTRGYRNVIPTGWLKRRRGTNRGTLS